MTTSKPSNAAWITLLGLHYKHLYWSCFNSPALL